MAFRTAALAALVRLARAQPLTCQDNEKFPMLPTYHIIGNVSQNSDGSIKLEPINDCSGVTYRDGIYHVWHQCCQNHWDHVISRDLIHWQRLPPPIQPVTLKTWDGSISMLDNADPLGPVMIYDAQDGKSHERAYHTQGNLSMPFDRPILGIARQDDPTDKYMVKWSRAKFNPVKFAAGPKAGIAFPGPIWKEGDHYNFIGQGSLFSSADDHFETWTRKDKNGKKVMDPLGGGRENSGQWMMPIPKAIDGSAAPSGAGAPNILLNVGGGDKYVFATWDNETETLTPWTAPAGAPKTGQVAHLEGGHASWWGASGGTDNNGRMMMIGWATPDFHGDAGPGIKFLTRLTGLREVNYDPKIQNLVANPVPELTKLRGTSLASAKGQALSTSPSVVKGTSGGKAASADVEISFSGFKPNDKMGACVLGSATNNTVGLSITITATASTTDSNVVAGLQVAVDQGCDPQKQPINDSSGSSSARQVVLHEGDDTITLRMMPDRSLSDFFVQGGQWSGTLSWPSKVPRAPADSDISVWGGAGVKADIDVWDMGCGWLNPSYTENPTI